MKNIKKIVYGSLITLLLSSSSYADCSYELFSISSTKDTKIIDFVEQLSDECEFSVIVTDPHAEKFLETELNKTHLKNLTIDEVLSIILKENNLYYTLENNILKISYLNTKVFGIDYILSQRKGVGSTNITLSSSSATSTPGAVGTSSTTASTAGASGSSSGGGSSAESGIKIESTDEVKFWEELDLEFQKVINTAQDIYQASAPIINKNAGLVTVTATLKQMNRLEGYLKKLQDKVQLQVLIDVQLLSVTMEEGKTTGVDWQQLYALQKVTLSANYLSKNNVPTFTGTEITTAGAQAVNEASLVTVKAGGTLDEVIKFLQTQGDVVSISNPKVLTLNNQPALITAGTEYFYKIKSETNQQGTGGGVAATTQNDTVQSVFAGVLLDITPEIADDKSITLKINPSLSETAQDISQESSANRVMPPDLNRRQLSSVVTVKDGNRIILGGLINTKNVNKSNKVPLLGDIPGLSYLFKYEEMTKQIQELVIVIEPHIIDKANNNLSLAELGYKGITDHTVILNKSSISNQADSLSKEVDSTGKHQKDNKVKEEDEK
ncbi:type II and III secretion system protein [Sulfurimonas gotlandica GD1]|uniref:Type II and III secretion system protein n=1 Tax=Sulfurimonas gotlandica (strain DSM 19862 / JCM 16533 / GD1) TaxID=929558 RepID=B6BMR5_SULGG|nr:pilus (MSHA type) biogenesis protein MshL [Sulfurimonas gotlandica]EDZ61661.1 type II and III secretion system protein [Sulfurimonas gotlandica GD1]EHP30818.1 type II and III secretion system protein [Sulfurimonas gotlandica GD1]